MNRIVQIFYVSFGVLMAAVGGLRIFAGYRNYGFRGRTVGLVALIAGLGSVMTCYCAPTAIGLAVYGLFVYLNPSVVTAFAMGDAGETQTRPLPEERAWS